MKKQVLALTLLALIAASSSANAAEFTLSDRSESREDPVFRWALGGYIALQSIDAWQTSRGTAMGLTETNPIFSSGQSMTAAKVALVPLTAWGLARLHRTRPRLARGLAIGLNVVYAGVVARNAQVISSVE